MFSCRAAWQICGPLARNVASRLPREFVQRRQMSSVPGGSGENIVYTLLCGTAFVGSVTYAYRTVSTDQARFNDRVTEINARPKTEWTPKPWPPKSKTDEEGSAENPTEAVAELAAQEVETVAEEVAKVAEVIEDVAQAVAESNGTAPPPVEEVASSDSPQA